MKALLAFSGGGGGSGFPGAPIAGVYVTATTPEFLSVCAEVVAVQYSIVVDAGAGGLAWYSDGSQMILLGGSVNEVADLPLPGNAGGVTFSIPSATVSVYENNNGQFWYWDGLAWFPLN